MRPALVPRPGLDHGQGAAPTPGWVTPSEAAVLFGVSVERVESLVAEGRVRVSGALRGRRRIGTAMVSGTDLRVALGQSSPSPEAPPPVTPQPRPRPAVQSAPKSLPDDPIFPRPAVSPSTGSGGPPPAPRPSAADRQRPAAPAEPASARHSDVDLVAGPRGDRSRHRRAIRPAAIGAAVVVVAVVVAISASRGPSSLTGGRPRATGGSSGPAGGPAPASPVLNRARFLVQDGRLATAATITNPNRGWWLPSLDVTIRVFGSDGSDIASSHTSVTVPPNGSAPAIVVDLPLPPGAPTPAGAQAVLGFPAWSAAASYQPPPVQILGTGLQSGPGGALRVGAMVSNSISGPVPGTIACVTRDSGGDLTGVATARVAIPAKHRGMVWVPVGRPAKGSTAAACQMHPGGR